MKSNTLVGLALLSTLVLPLTARAGTNCTTAKEYVTSLEFLREQKDLKIPEPEARKVAARVSNGCSGAGLRFIRSYQLLSRSGFGAKDSVETAIALSHKTDAEVETFVTVFQTAFLKELLDLDLQASFEMAKSLSTEFNGSSANARDDFKRLVEFCVKERALNLPKPECGAFAARIARKGEPFSGLIAVDFIKTFEFAVSKTGPGLDIASALRVAEQVVASGPGAAENFILGYRYAASKSGLELQITDALQFAQELASRSNSIDSVKN